MSKDKNVMDEITDMNKLSFDNGYLTACRELLEIKHPPIIHMIISHEIDLLLAKRKLV